MQQALRKWHHTEQKRLSAPGVSVGQGAMETVPLPMGLWLLGDSIGQSGPDYLKLKRKKSNKWATDILSDSRWRWELTKNEKQEWWWAVKTLRKEENRRREDAKANVWKSVFIVAFWASTRAVIMLFLTGRKDVLKLRWWKKAHRSLSYVNDGM